MVDPERQFRKYLQWDGESAWVSPLFLSSLPPFSSTFCFRVRSTAHAYKPAVRPPTTPQKIQRLDPLGLDKDGNKYYHLADDRLWIQRRAPSASSPSGADSPALDEGQYGQQAIKKPKTLLGLRAGPRDKSKKGTVTGTIRVKLKKDKVTGKYLQVTEDEPENEGGEDEEEKVHPEREVEEVEMPVWEREYWEERQRAENTPGFVEWEAVRFLSPSLSSFRF